ncbi:molybdopterin molybdenumtransferase MoeA [Pedobacter yonginense]|uniref:Molybdopterin molybdenumtransferase n=1 Tax=Pedobacter yonginense TaxID=651869 RepID=A0A317EHG0_9SPHI|nr:gephyrin-like molybdotransferase Glp [Pedobacter yonginense]PWS26024.1 molybdopterin molybdenumtransferase MoeA [Pedobacter yonginense]
MITVAEAKALIAENIASLNPLNLPIEQASRHILAADVFAKYDIPQFRQSSMDGYALRFEEKDLALQIDGEMAAGTASPLSLAPGKTARIFTGAPLPDGADTVVMQEKVSLSEGKLTVLDDRLQEGVNVRAVGSEIKANALAMHKGSILSPAAIGFLAGIGITEVPVYPLPTVSIIVTGKELQSPGEELGFGQVYESNSYSLSAALKQAGIIKVDVICADDDLEILTGILDDALKNSDVVLLTGGVSVGDYDFVLEASKRCKVNQIFHKVKQRPGKPLFFGMQGAKPVFGLPGNPSSVLSCFYNYVLPALFQMARKENPVKEIYAKLTAAYNKPSGLSHFLKGTYQNGLATPLSAQESFRLSSFAYANCLICLNEGVEQFEKGDHVTILLIPD